MQFHMSQHLPFWLSSRVSSLSLLEDMSPIPEHWERAGIGRGLVEGQSRDYLPDDDEVSLEGSEAGTEPGADVPTASRKHAREPVRAFSGYLVFTRAGPECCGARRTSWHLKCPRIAQKLVET